MNTTATVTLVRVEDHEGTGTCGACDREGLRWIAVLSDGSRVGVECAKKVLGWKPAPASYSWVEFFEPIAEHDDFGAVYVLWQQKNGAQTRVTRAGSTVLVGGGRDFWTREGWAA